MRELMDWTETEKPCGPYGKWIFTPTQESLDRYDRLAVLLSVALLGVGFKIYREPVDPGGEHVHYHLQDIETINEESSWYLSIGDNEDGEEKADLVTPYPPGGWADWEVMHIPIDLNRVREFYTDERVKHLGAEAPVVEQIPDGHPRS